MTANLASLLRLPPLNASYWIALCSATAALALVLQNSAFPAALAMGALALRCINSPLYPKIGAAVRFLFTFSAYLFALAPLWSESYLAYGGLPLASLLSVCLIAALNGHSFGGSRAIVSMGAIAFLLFLQNVFLTFEFKAPTEELAASLAFVAFMEIALSQRYRNSEDSPLPEFVSGLILSLLASFQITSLPLATLLAVLPMVSFLMRNQQLAQSPNEQAQPSTPLPAFQRHIRFPLAVYLLPLALACLLYGLLLQVPFWAEKLPADAPYQARSLAEKAKLVATSSNLQDEAIRSATNALLEKILPEKSGTNPDLDKHSPNANPLSIARYDPESKPDETERPNPGYSQPTITSQTNADRIITEQGQKQPVFSPSGWESPSPTIQLTPPRASLGSEIPSSFDLGVPAPDANDPYEITLNQPSKQPRARGSQTPPSRSQADQGSAFERFLDAFERPAQAITESLNLEDNDVAALLSQRAILTVKVDDPRQAPRRLYLRSNVLDTISSDGFGGAREEAGRITKSTLSPQPISVPSFQRSQSQAATVTITSLPKVFTTLPLPESFSQLEPFGFAEIDLYPEDAVALTPSTTEPFSYRLLNADLDIADRESTPDLLSDDYRERMLEVPLSRQERAYLRSLARRVGGANTSARQFASRFAAYFDKRHPYSYFVEIPEGDGHPVVRWLKNQAPGLCSNYAAAFALLARSQGIPTRVVTGLASDEFDRKEGRYLFRESHAHAWVEYLNESKQWIRFDPTPAISEAEARRTEAYASDPSPETLLQLVKAEQRLNRLAPTDFPEIPLDTSSTAKATATTEPDPQPQPSKELVASALASTAPKSTTSTPLVPPTQPKPSPELANPTVPKPTPESPEPLLDSAANPAAQTTPSNSSTPAPIANPDSPLWLPALLLLAFGLPALLYAVTRRQNRSLPPQLQLRQKAGRLLTQLDALLKLHGLRADPVWTATRETLESQRYGREANALLIQDVAIKVGLLSKKKPPPKQR